MTKRIFQIALVCFFITSLLLAGNVTSEKIKIDSHTFGAIEARSIGPAVMGGRISALDVVNSNPRIIYVGAASGGVWKSISGGTTFKPVFDKHNQSIGAIAIDQSHPDTVWVGTGETWVRNSVSVGDGLYKTTDGGDNWERVGLDSSERISRILIHPKNSKIVYVGAMGQLWNSNEQRGVYKTIDGGKTWEKVLYIDEHTGCADLAMDPQEPDILYAAMWQFRRSPYFFKSGGPGSGLYRSTDGGKTWKKLQGGLPAEELGRIAIAIAPSRPSTVYAVVEAKKSALYRSDDLGENWTRRDSSATIGFRPFYFSLVLVDPQDHNRVYKPGLYLTVSTDGGKTFATRTGFHPDLHALWINPANPYHLVLGTDGGIYVSYDRGNSWLFLNNLPVSQFYRASFDMEKPYHVYGGLQDNGSWYGPSRSPGGITNADWKNCGFGDGFWVFVDPHDSDIIYSEYQGGNISRLHRNTGERKDIKPYPGEAEGKYRFNWNAPIHVTKNALYIGAQFLFRSTDKGDSWEKISPDLTTNDPKKQRQEQSGGITIDNTTAENHCTIYSICESPLDKNIIWVGTDDGNVQVTSDGGKTWTNVVKNIPDLPAHTWCSWVEVSPHDRGAAYATFDGHRTGDMNVYVYRTEDLGTTWQSIATPDIKGYVHVIREDLVKPGLLFLGTEFGLFISIDAGEQWAQFTGNFPPVPVMDIAIHPRDHDVILATHGRGIYIIDDITSLRQIAPEVVTAEVHVFDTSPVVIRPQVGSQRFPGSNEFVGSNPSEVARVVYYLKKRHVFGDFKVEIYDPDGKLLKTLPGGKRRGINIVDWQMRQKPPKVAPAPTLAGGALFGPIVPEGIYPVKLIKGNATYTTEIKVIYDPDSPHSAEDRAEQQNTVWKLYRMQEQLAYLGDAVTSARDKARDQAKRLKKGDGFVKTLLAFADKLDQFNKTLVATRTGAGITGEQQLREKVVELYASVSNYAGKPTESQLTRINALEKEIVNKNAEFDSIISKELNSMNRKLEGKKLEPIEIMTKEAWDKKQDEN